MLRAEINPPDELMRATFNEANTEQLRALDTTLRNIDDWTETSLRATIQGWLAEHHLTLRDIGAPMRTALLGTPNSPELFAVLGAMGRDKSLRRLDNTLARLQPNL